jgi:hypothetical protein
MSRSDYMKITVITMYRGYDAELFVHVVEGPLTEELKESWRKSHKCDQFHCDSDPIIDDCDDHNNLFFRELEVCKSSAPCSLKNVDGELFKEKRDDLTDI